MFTLERFSHTSIYKLTIESRVRDEEHSDGTIRVSSLVVGWASVCLQLLINTSLIDVCIAPRVHASILIYRLVVLLKLYDHFEQL